MSNDPTIRGPKGDRGERGPIGLEGPQGPEGPIGPEGLEGPEGPEGPIGLAGIDGEQGPKGERGQQGLKGEPGKKGKDGKDGKDADLSEVKVIADVKAKDAVKAHEKKFDHTQIDSFLIGSKKLSEAGMKLGDVITFDGDGLVYTTIKQISSKVSHLAGRGLSLPSQSTRVDRILQTDGSKARWGMKISVSATEPANPELYDIWLDIS